jgi:hypothetical protein
MCDTRATSRVSSNTQPPQTTTEQPQGRPEKRSIALTRQSKNQVPSACRPRVGQGITARPPLETIGPGQTVKAAAERMTGEHRWKRTDLALKITL